MWNEWCIYRLPFGEVTGLFQWCTTGEGSMRTLLPELCLDSVYESLENSSFITHRFFCFLNGSSPLLASLLAPFLVPNGSPCSILGWKQVYDVFDKKKNSNILTMLLPYLSPWVPMISLFLKITVTTKGWRFGVRKYFTNLKVITKD